MKRLKVYLLVSVLMALPALIIGCSKSVKAKNPLKSMTIEEVRRMVEDWNRGRLPEQRAEPLSKSEREVVEQEIQKAEDEFNALKSEAVVASELPLEHYQDRRSRLTQDYQRDKKALEEAARLRYRESLDKIDADFRAAREVVNKKGIWTKEGWDVDTESTRRYLMKKRDLQTKTDAERTEEQRLYKAYLESLANLDAEIEDIWRRGLDKAGRYADAKRKVDEARAKLNPVNTEHHSSALFLEVFGDPYDKQLIERTYYFYYECKDGMVQLILSLGTFQANMVNIDSVNLY